jgi:elongation factor 2
MKRWLPVADQLLKMAELHLPSPQEAQRYRAPLLYQGPEDDAFCRSMQQCNPEGTDASSSPDLIHKDPPLSMSPR